MTTPGGRFHTLLYMSCYRGRNSASHAAVHGVGAGWLPHLLMQLRLGCNRFLLIWALCILLNGGPQQSVMQRLGRSFVPLPLLCTSERHGSQDSTVMLWSNRPGWHLDLPKWKLTALLQDHGYASSLHDA